MILHGRRLHDPAYRWGGDFEVTICDLKIDGRREARRTVRMDPMAKKSKTALLALPVGMVERRIHIVRKQRVMLDSDLAELYEVATKAFNQAVGRNLDRFPADFMIRLTAEEVLSLRSQFVTSNSIGSGGRRYLPYAFTEQGIAMLSSVLNSPRSVLVNIAIMRAFVQIREIATTHKDLMRKVKDMEKKYDHNFRAVFSAIKTLMDPPPVPPKRRIGFKQ